jgi:NAD(P)-dependent dehydrogenase (short-subunit alcohol dehydrogenase family)
VHDGGDRSIYIEDPAVNVVEVWDFFARRPVAAQGRGRIVNISMNEQTMVRRGFVPYGPAGAGVEALSRVMAADLSGSSVTVNVLLPGGRGTLTGMVPDDVPAEVRARLQDPAVIGPPIVWLASDQAAGVHDQRIVATDFDAATIRP